MRRRWTLPLALGLITAVLVAAALWPHEPPRMTVVVAARDLGAGATLAAADLTTAELDAAQAPADAVADPAVLVGQTLAVVRFAGEPMTPRHLGPAVTLAPDERGLAIKVKADTGLAGLLRPGMRVGVIATLAETGTARDVYAKTVLEGLRVLYVSPDFQARPYTPASAAATVAKTGNTGALGAEAPPAASPGNSGTVREGVLVLAAGTHLQAVRYEAASLQVTAPMTATVALDGTPAPTPTPEPGASPTPEPPVRWLVPVEMLAALNAAGDSLTLTLLPEDPQSYTTTGANVSDVRPPTATPEAGR